MPCRDSVKRRFSSLIFASSHPLPQTRFQSRFNFFALEKFRFPWGIVWKGFQDCPVCRGHERYFARLSLTFKFLKASEDLCPEQPLKMPPKAGTFLTEVRRGGGCSVRKGFQRSQTHWRGPLVLGYVSGLYPNQSGYVQESLVSTVSQKETWSARPKQSARLTRVHKHNLGGTPLGGIPPSNIPKIEAQNPTPNPDIQKKHRVHTNFFDRFARTSACFVWHELGTQQKSSRKLVRMKLFSRARKPWSANCELKHWIFRGWKCLIHGLRFTV